MGIILKITTYVESVKKEGSGIIIYTTGKSVRGQKDGIYTLSFTDDTLRELLQREHVEYKIISSNGFKQKDEEIKPDDKILIKMKSQSNKEVDMLFNMERLFDMAEGGNPIRSSGPFMTYDEQENSKAGLMKNEHVVLMIQHVHDEDRTNINKLLVNKQILILLTGK